MIWEFSKESSKNPSLAASLFNASPVPLTARKTKPLKNHVCWTWAALPTLLLLLLPAKLQHKAAGWTFWNSPGSGHPLVALHCSHTLFSAQGCSIPAFSKASLQVTQALLWTVIGLTHGQDAAERKSQKVLSGHYCNYFGVYPPVNLNVSGLSRHREQIWFTRRNIMRTVLATLSILTV